MGKLLQGAASAGLNAVTGGVGGAIASGVTGLLGLIGRKKRERQAEQKQIEAEKRAMENQIAMNEAANKSNFEWNEKAAENADKRGRALYEQYQSPEAMVSQYEKAGLNAGLMYSAAGGGSGAGVLTGGKQGGASGGAAATASTGAQSYQAQLMAQQVASQIKVNDAQAALMGAQAGKVAAETDNTKANTNLTKEKTLTEKETRPLLIETMRQSGIKVFTENMDNAIKRGAPEGWFKKSFGNEIKETENGYQIDDIIIETKAVKNEIFGFTYAMAQNSYLARNMAESLEKLILDNNEKNTVIKLNNINIEKEKLKTLQEIWGVLLKEGEVKKIYVDMAVAMQNADSQRISALAEQMQTIIKAKEYELKEKATEYETFNFSKIYAIHKYITFPLIQLGCQTMTSAAGAVAKLL